MDDTINLILLACKQAKDLEVSLPNVANQPSLLSKSCEDIIAILSAAKQRIDRQSPDSEQRSSHMSKQLFHTSLGPGILMPQSTYLVGQSSGNGLDRAWTERQGEGTGDVAVGGEIPGILIPDVSQERATSTPSRRHRRRNNGEDMWTIRIGASRIGNPEIPPDDGYTWRKYGQKEILGSKFPRGYFRCTHQKLYRCPAKKQVQRIDDDPSTFEVTYRHHHACHMSSTAPSAPPRSLQPLIYQETTHVITTAPSQPVPMLPAGSSSTWMHIAFDIGSTSAPRGTNVGGDITGPSVGQSSREPENPFSASITNEVLNYGVGHGSGIDFMFPDKEERWKGGDQK